MHEGSCSILHLHSNFERTDAMKMAITQSIVDQAKPETKPYEIRDKNLIGFLVRVQSTGIKTYYCEYRRGSRIRICPTNVCSVKIARLLARQVLANYYQGGEKAVKGEKPKSTMTFRVFLEEHYFQWVEANHKGSKSTKRCLLVDCAPFLKEKLENIVPAKVEKWRLAKVSAGNSPHTANRSYATLRASLTKAEEWGFLAEHPLRKMKPLKTVSNLKIRFLSQDEEERMRYALNNREKQMRLKRLSGNVWREQRNHAPLDDLHSHVFADHLKPMVILSMNTGIRRGELFSLQWRNVDFVLRQLTVEGTNAKSRKSRHIPLNKEALYILENWKEKYCNPESYVFTNKHGQQFVDIKNSWKRLLELADIDSFRFHDLRHNFASKLAIAGVSLNTIRDLLGHASYTQTLRYAHLSEDHKAEAVALLG